MQNSFCGFCGTQTFFPLILEYLWNKRGRFVVIRRLYFKLSKIEIEEYYASTKSIEYFQHGSHS